MTDITTETLALDAAATPGPWRVAPLTDGEVVMLTGPVEEWETGALTVDDARLCVRYRTLAPELAREVQRLEAENERLEDLYEGEAQQIIERQRMRIDRLGQAYDAAMVQVGIQKITIENLSDDVIEDLKAEIKRHHADFERWEATADKGARQIEENKRLREIVEALSAKEPIDFSHDTDGEEHTDCALCREDLCCIDSAHDPACPYRLAVEYVQERSEG